MSLEIEATFEDGVLKPSVPLNLLEHEVVQVQIERRTGNDAASANDARRQQAKDAVLRTSGLISWTGDPELLRRIALDDEFGVMEAP